VSKAYRIAVLEDNRALCEELLLLLEEEGYQTAGFSHAGAFIESHRSQPFTVVLLDLGLPDRDGITVADELSRKRDDIGIIMLSARDSVHDRVKGLLVGADAYLVKPFEFEELTAHVNALIRRKSLYASPSGEWVLNVHAQLLSFSENTVEPLSLSAQELSILKVLAMHYPESVLRIEMVEALGEDYRVYDERRLEKNISRLRKRLSEYWGMAPIKAVRNKGYVFEAPIRVISNGT
jgi:DNA-binding response OmpR family regulator